MGAAKLEQLQEQSGVDVLHEAPDVERHAQTQISLEVGNALVANPLNSCLIKENSALSSSQTVNGTRCGQALASDETVKCGITATTATDMVSTAAMPTAAAEASM